LQQAIDPLLLILGLAVVAIVLSPFAAEDRAPFRNPDKKPRPTVDPHWRREP
jgi:hypothetical protein